MFSALASAALSVVLSAFGATAVQAAPPVLAITELSWQQSTVDASPGGVDNQLDFAVTNADPQSHSQSGDLTVRMRSSVTGGFLGHERLIRFRSDTDCCSDAWPQGDNTPQRYVWTYAMPVLPYTDGTSVTWEVTRAELWNDRGARVVLGANALRAFGYSFTATTRVDTTGPATDSAITLVEQERPFVYAGGAPRTMHYLFTLADFESGIWRGTLTLAGPAGQTVSAPVTWGRSTEHFGYECGVGGTGPDGPHGVVRECVVPVTIPGGAASGAWRVSSLVVLNNAGGRTTYRNPAAPALTVSSNDTVRAGDFRVDPEHVDNWRGDATAELRMTVTGLRRGLSRVLVDFSSGGCVQTGEARLAGDTLTVPVTLYQGFPGGCEVTGLVIVDGANRAAIHGSRYQAPDPRLVVTPIPNTTPPVALGATADPSIMAGGEAHRVHLAIRTETRLAPIENITLDVYGPDGALVRNTVGGAYVDPDGTVRTVIDVPFHWRGVYRVGFTLHDASGLSTTYDRPAVEDSKPLPGGPLTLTVTD